MTLETEMVAVDLLKTDGNPAAIPQAVIDQMANFMQKHGPNAAPILVNRKTMQVISGFSRLAGARTIGLAEVLVAYAPTWTDEDRRRHSL